MAKANDKLDKFLHSFYDNRVSINTKWTQKEICDINEAVHELVERIVSLRFQDYIAPEDIGHHILPVGSAYECTQIVDLNDFDFTIILPYLSEKNMKVKNDCKNKTCLCGKKDNIDDARAHLIYTGDVNMLPHDIRELIRLDSYVWNLATGRYLHVTLKNTLDKMFVNKTQPKIEKPTGTLILELPHASQGDTVANTIRFQWKSKSGKKPVDCTIDLAFAIRLSKDWGFTLTDCSERLKSEAEAGSCYILPSMNIIAENLQYGRFSISFVETETRLIRRLKDSSQWIVCYQFVKFIFKETFNGKSYILKTIVLQLAYDSMSSHQEPTLADCMYDVVHKVLSLLQKPEVGKHETLCSVWFKTHVLLCVNELYKENDSPFPQRNGNYNSKPNLKYIEDLLRFFETIRNDKIYEYKKYCSEIEAIMKRDKTERFPFLAAMDRYSMGRMEQLPFI